MIDVTDRTNPEAARYLSGITPEERELLTWLYGLEDAASGTTIFVHRHSAPGLFLCECACRYCVDYNRFIIRAIF